VTHAVRLPAGWTESPIGDVLAPLDDSRTIHQGWSPQCEKTASLSDAEWGVLKTTAIQDGKFCPEHNKLLPAHLDPRPLIEVHDGDLILTCAGPRARCGVPCLVRSTRPRLMLSGKMYRFRTSNESLDARYLESYLRSPAAQVSINRMKTGISDSGLNLTQKRFKQLPVPVAPLHEQRRIVEAIESYLTRLDDAVASLERVQRNLERYRASVLKAAVEGRLVPTEAELARREGLSYEPTSELLKRILAERKRRWIEDAAEKARAKAEAKALKAGKPWTPEENAVALDKARKTAEAKYKEPTPPDLSALQTQAGTTDLPEGWCWAAAEQLAYRVTDGEHQTPPRTDSGVPLISARNVLNGRLSLEDVDFVSRETHQGLCHRLKISAGDVLLSCSGTVGRACVVPPGMEFSMVRSVAVLMPALPIGSYIELSLRSPVLQEQIDRKKTETAQANIFQGKIRRLAFPLPPVNEQRRITDCAGECFAMADHIEKEIQAAEAKSSRLRQSILKWAFEGKLVEQNPNDEPASALLERNKAERASAATKPKRKGKPS